MSLLFYHLFCWIYPLLLRLVSPLHPKARAWVIGRKEVFSRLEQLRGQGRFIWMHCASLGEFEQGRPVLESIRKHYPNYKILLTFFSPSGYEHLKNYPGADFIEYLPMDGPSRAKRFIELVNPELVVFVKYEFWFFYLKKLHYRNIPLLLISAYFRPEMSFFRWYGKLSRKMLSRFDRIFVQDDRSKQLLAEVGITSIVEVSGDTRFDRVVAIAETGSDIEGAERLLRSKRSIIIGSSWRSDEEVWAAVRPTTQSLGIQLVVVPHELSVNNLERIATLFPGAQTYSELPSGVSLVSDVLIIDRIGLLATLYRYGWISYVGGGFDRNGVHNVLEAAVYSRPVITGPRIEKYREAVELLAANGSIALPEKDAAIKLEAILTAWSRDSAQADEMGRCAGQYVRARTGAVQKILNHIQEKRLLTS